MANDDSLSRLAEALDRASQQRRDSFGAAEIISSVSGAAREQRAERITTEGVLSQQANSQMTRLIDSLDQTRSVQQVYIQAQAQQTRAILQNALAKPNSADSDSGSSGGGIVDTIVNRFVRSPIAGAILGLFGRRNEDPPLPLPTYTLPASIHINAGYSANTEGISRNIDYGQDGLPRVMQAPAAAVSPQITVQVQALDSRSFLDHSEEIARAVRHAVLNSHALGDVVSEL